MSLRTLRGAALVPLLGWGGSWIDAAARRGGFQPVISSYHAICAQNRRDWRCARLTEFHATDAVAEIKRAAVPRGPAEAL